MLACPEHRGDHSGGRFASLSPAEALARIFGTMSPLANPAPSRNVAPAQEAAVVRRLPPRLACAIWIC